MHVSERINLIINHLGLNKNSFSKAIGLTNNVTIGKILNDKRSPSFDILTRIIQTYDCINSHWLLTGKGEMLTTTEKEVNPNVKEAGHVTGEIALNPIDDKPDFDEDDPEFYQKTIKAKSARIAELDSLLETSNKMVTGSLKEIQRLKLKIKQLTDELSKYKRDSSIG